ncbi:hypothetical protein MSSAC_2783 [Methanosarcina siciliae C2J]|uniref:Phage head morphogenesis domain-containing protein n=1 Tax=Methanosarcina siciliae C2J TaxID=1434118 RepID=A0A0E3PQU9_9EURY|nr:phage minor head protein [Methanosarcina siciliae]AKB37373.1 hypothetical protein MSSAC_2783 [Methanosarcina siciliae C2J]
MAIDLEVLDKNIDKQVKTINAAQAAALTIEISAGFVAGLEAGEKKTSFLRSSSEELTEVQKETIEKLSAEYFGYIAEFNEAAGEQLKDRAREIIKQGGPEQDLKDEIRKYAEDIWGGSETVTIDRTGQTRTVIEVGKDRKLRKVEKEITRAYKTNVDAYADMLARTSTHGAYEEGRAAAYQEEGQSMWRFVGPVDERSRPDHSALVGEHFTYGTPESDMALQLLHEPNCRHRAIVYFGDPDLDTPQEEYEKQKEKAGLYYDEEKGKWAFKESGKTTKKTKQKKAPAKKETEKKKEETKPIEINPKTTDIETIFREYEKPIKDNDFETAVILDNKGNFIFSKKGNKKSVSFTAEELGKVRGNQLTHNHPRNTSFSLGDVKLSSTYNVTEIRACGKKYIYSMKPGETGWNKEYFNKKIKPLYTKHYNEVYSDLFSQAISGEISDEEWDLMQNHMVWERVADELGLIYKKTEW